MNSISERRSILRETNLAYDKYQQALEDYGKLKRTYLNWGRERKGWMFDLFAFGHLRGSFSNDFHQPGQAKFKQTVGGEIVAGFATNQPHGLARMIQHVLQENGGITPWHIGLLLLPKSRPGNNDSGNPAYSDPLFVRTTRQAHTPDDAIG